MENNLLLDSLHTHRILLGILFLIGAILPLAAITLWYLSSRLNGYVDQLAEAPRALLHHTSTSMRQRRRMLLYAILIAFALRLAVVPFVYDEWMSPYMVAHYEQGNVAQALLSGHGFGSPFLSQQPSAVMPPVYPIIVAAVFALAGIHTAPSMLILLALNCFFSALACHPIWLFAKRSFGPRRARWALWLWVFSPYGIYFSAEWPWSTHLLLLALCWQIVVAQNMERSTKPALWAFAGLLAGFTALVEPSAIVVSTLLFVLALCKNHGAKKLLCMRAALAMAVLLLGIAPWMLRNALVFHRFIPMRDGMGLEMYLGNNGDSFHWRTGTLHPNHNASELAEYRNGELAYMDHKSLQASQYIHAHKIWFLWMSARRAQYLWTGYWSFDPAYLAEEPLDLANVPFTSAITMLSLLGLIVLYGRSRFDAFRYGGILMFYPALYYFSHPEAYRMRPLDPIFGMLSGVAIVWIIDLVTAYRHSAQLQPVTIAEDGSFAHLAHDAE